MELCLCQMLYLCKSTVRTNENYGKLFNLCYLLNYVQHSHVIQPPCVKTFFKIRIQIWCVSASDNKIFQILPQLLKNETHSLHPPLMYIILRKLLKESNPKDQVACYLKSCNIQVHLLINFFPFVLLPVNELRKLNWLICSSIAVDRISI